MNLFILKLCLIVVIIVTQSSVKAEDDEINVLKEEKDFVPSEQIIDTNDVLTTGEKVSAGPTEKHVGQSLLPISNSKNIRPNNGYRLEHGLIPNLLVGHPLDAQASSDSNNVVLVLANDKNELADPTKSAEESIKRLTRNPDVVDEMVGQFHQFGGNVAQQMLEQMAITVPEMSRTFGQVLNEVLSQTALLAQTPPDNIDFSPLTQTLSKSNQPRKFDFGQLGESLRRPFIVGAATPELKADTDNVAQSKLARRVSETQRNPFEGIVGQSLLPSLGFSLPPLGLFPPLTLFNPLLSLPSEISEVRVKSEQHSPFKITSKEVYHPTMAEMRLKAILMDAITKKTIPVLWFHLPRNHNLQKTTEDLEMEAKLKIFEKQVISELKQLQELSKLANEMKNAQLQSGIKPTTSLTTKLNLSEIPIYEITLGDIERTLRDEHVAMLIHTVVQNYNKNFPKHQKLTIKYLVNLMDVPIKRETFVEDALKTMSKDDISKIMTYAYRMAALNGHKIPWLRNERISDLNTNDTGELITNQQRQPLTENMERMAEKQWLEDKQRQMAIEIEKQRKLSDDRIRTNTQQNIFVRQRGEHNMHWPMPIQRRMLPPQMQQHTPIQTQMTDASMQLQQQEMERKMIKQQVTPNFNVQPKFPMQKQWSDDSIRQQQGMIMQHQVIYPMLPQQKRYWINPNMEQQQIIQRQWADLNMAQTSEEWDSDQEPEQPAKFFEQRQWIDPKTIKTTEVATLEQLPNSNLKKSDQQSEQILLADAKIIEQTATNTTQGEWVDPNNHRKDTVPTAGEAKLQTDENAGKARFQGNLFGVFPHNLNYLNADSTYENRSGIIDWFNQSNMFGRDRSADKVTIRYHVPVDSPFMKPPASYLLPPTVTRPLPPHVLRPLPSPASQLLLPLTPRPTLLSRPYSNSPPPLHKFVLPDLPGSSIYKPVDHYEIYDSYKGNHAAVGDEEIIAMLQQHQHILIESDYDYESEKIFYIRNQAIEGEEEEVGEETDNGGLEQVDELEQKAINETEEKKYKTSSPLPSTVSTSSIITLSPLKNSNDSGLKVGSLFGFEQQILKPFMGLHSVVNKIDSWYRKTYNLYQPTCTESGTFKEHLRKVCYTTGQFSSNRKIFAKNLV